MVDITSIVEQARKLSPEEQAKLIEALWDAIPEGFEIPLHPEWASELERRIDALKAGTATTIPWAQVRAEAMARIGHDATA